MTKTKQVYKQSNNDPWNASNWPIFLIVTNTRGDHELLRPFHPFPTKAAPSFCPSQQRISSKNFALHFDWSCICYLFIKGRFITPVWQVTGVLQLIMCSSVRKKRTVLCLDTAGLSPSQTGSKRAAETSLCFWSYLAPRVISVMNAFGEQIVAVACLVQTCGCAVVAQGLRAHQGNGWFCNRTEPPVPLSSTKQT